MLTLHHLNDSRSQRILWLLEELGTPYEMKRYQRDATTRLAPPELEKIHPLGKSPVITDVGRLKEAGAPLHPRIDSEIANHLRYVDGALKDREFFVGPSLTGADIQMSFVGEMAKVFDKLGPYPNLKAWLTRMHARPAFQRSVEKGGAYRFAK